MNRIRTLTGAGLLAVLIAACGTSSPSPSASEASPTPSDAAPSSSNDTSGPSFTEGAAADLEAFIPETIGDLAMTRTSMNGDQYLGSDDVDEQTAAFLEEIGADPQDISMAIGYGFSEDFSQVVSMIVFRAEGANQDALVAAFKASMDADSDTPTVWTDASVGGKSVETSGSVEEDGQVTYLYARGDTLFFFGTNDPALAEEVLAGLP